MTLVITAQSDEFHRVLEKDSSCHLSFQEPGVIHLNAPTPSESVAFLPDKYQHQETRSTPIEYLAITKQ